MAIIQIPNLPAVIGLDGSELFEGVQAGTSVKISLAQMIAAARGGLPTTLPIPVSVGGTGLDTFTVGDIMYASATQTFSKLADVATGNAIISGGVGVAPSYGKIGLTTHVDGTLPVANGGTGVTTLTGYVKGSGTSPFTASPTIPNTDITGLGTMSTQNADAVAITGGTAALTGASSVTVNSSSTAFTVTQTGAGNAFLVEDSASDTTPFVIDASGNVGIGTTSPTYKLDVVTSGTAGGRVTTAEYGQFVVTDGSRSIYLQNYAGVGSLGTSSNNPLMFAVNNLERMRIDASGNVGIGVTPSASTLPTVESLYGLFVGSTETNITANAYFGSSWKYVNTAAASKYTQYLGSHQWFNAPSGTAGNAITFTQAMTLDASGNLGVGTSSPGEKLHVNGAATSAFTQAIFEGNNQGGIFLRKVGSAGAGIYALSDASMSFQLTAEAVRITAAGNVGIGTTSPLSRLVVSNGSGENFEISTGNVSLNGGVIEYLNRTTGATRPDFNYYLGANGAHKFYTGGTERFRVGPSGQWGIGGANYGTTGQAIVSAGAAAAPAWGTLPLTGGGTGVTTAPAAAAVLLGYTSTATAAGTTVLTNTSTQYQLFTGTLAQTITLPVTSTLTTGWSFHIVNNSTGSLTVNSSGGNLVVTVIAGLSAMVTCIGTTLTTAADWEPGLTDFQSATGTGSVVLGTAPTITNALISASNAIRATGTLALAFATNTFVQVTPNATGTFTTTVPVVGTTCTLIVLTSGVTSFVMTFGTGFKTTGTLTTGTVSARYFVFRFVSDGTNLIEASRTIAIA